MKAKLRKVWSLICQGAIQGEIIVANGGGIYINNSILGGRTMT